MALVITQSVDYNKFMAKIGCGLIYCLEEDSYKIKAGKKSFIPIVFNFYSNIINGDTMNLHGVDFKFVTGTPANLNEIQINGLNTAINVFGALTTLPFFVDNYNITQPNQFEIHIQAKVIQTDIYYNFAVVTGNSNSILINPFYPPLLIQAGSDSIVKDGYKVCLDVYDAVTDTKVCSVSNCKPLNVLSDGSTKVCFDVQKIIEDYGNIFSNPPAPLPTVSSGTQDWDWADQNYIGKFYFRFTSTYQDPNTSDCKRITGNSYLEPKAPNQIQVVNMVLDPDSDYMPTDFDFFNVLTLPVKPITIHTEDYLFCIDTKWEWRVDLPVDLIMNVFGGIAQIRLEYRYTDNTSNIYIFPFSTNFDGVQTISMALGDTFPAPNPTKKLNYVHAIIEYTVLANPFVTVTEKRWYFQVDSQDCCKCHKQFYFLSKLGNNETILATCDITEDFEIEQFNSYKEFQCGGDVFLDTPIFSGGNMAINNADQATLPTVNMYCQNQAYLKAFLESPQKWVYEDGKLYNIMPTANSYKIYQKNQNRFVLPFQYKKTIDSVLRHFSS